ncbi:hypothetical protein E3N88_20801 [Mikania micrantha]|uniref:Uncharacterized protein n=1 Tax=Mikania micrantha TaxID=192012 RepID=A0A5N6NKV3_9ASTR|nr:hypothetical protein E3N88_20801 [Mikania micrantha]
MGLLRATGLEPNDWIKISLRLSSMLLGPSWANQNALGPKVGPVGFTGLDQQIVEWIVANEMANEGGRAIRPRPFGLVPFGMLVVCFGRDPGEMKAKESFR